MSDFTQHILRLYKERQLSKEVTISLVEAFKEANKPNLSSWQDIAVVGVSCRLPEAENQHDFWQNILSKRNSIRDLPKKRSDRILPLTQGIPDDQFKSSGSPFWKAGYLDDVEGFDADFFGMLPSDATFSDPQQRIFLELAYEAFEDAGLTASALSGSRTGIFIGDVNVEYKELIREATAPGVTGNISPFICGRIARFFNLRGPTLNISTTCSSSLIAVHSAIQSLILGDCETALTGAINLRLFPFDLKNDPIDALGIISEDNLCRTFDEEANGIVRGEGGVAIVLKSLKTAIEDGDQIYAKIIASKVNSDGKSSSVGAPNPLTQEKLVSDALAAANISADTIQFVEAHGTGTKIGDPIEFQALQRAFRKHTDKKQYCGIGSLKTNIGHLTGGAAGVAGLLKVVLSLRHGFIPPSLHFNKPNSFIDFYSSPFFFVDESMPYKKDQGPARAAVSSFGFNGSNAHLILEANTTTNDKSQEEGREPPSQIPFVFSAKTEDALDDLLRKHLRFIKDGLYDCYNILDIAYTLAFHREVNEVRCGVYASSLQELASWLSLSSNKRKIFANSFDDNNDTLQKIAPIWMEKNAKVVSLATYCFQKKSFWIENGNFNRSIYFSKDNIDLEVPSMHSLKSCWQKVTGIDSINSSSNFFKLGGDSLLAQQLISAIEDRFNIRLSYRDFSENSTFSDMLNILTIRYERAPNSDQVIGEKTKETNAFPLSHSQKRIWLANQFSGETNPYNMPQVLRIKGKFDCPSLLHGLNLIVSRHPALRTRFEDKNGELTQIVESKYTIEEIPFYDLSDKSHSEILNHIDQAVYRKIDLTRLPLFICQVLKVKNEKHLFVFSIDHIVCDGWSLHVLLNDLIRCCRKEKSSGQTPNLASFISEESSWLKSSQADKAKRFWSKHLDEAPFVEWIPTPLIDRTASSIGRDLQYRVSAHDVQKAQDLATKSQTTIFTIYMASVYVLINKLTKQQDIVLGTFTSGRDGKTFSDLIGCFVNTLPVRLRILREDSFQSFIDRLKEVLFDCFDHSKYPFDKIADDNLKRGGSDLSNPFFSISVAQQNFTFLRQSKESEQVIENFHLPSKTCKWNLQFEFILNNKEIDARVEYADGVYKESDIQFLIEQHKKTFANLVSDPGQLLLRDSDSDDQEFSFEWNFS